jgi:hypothetical protein
MKRTYSPGSFRVLAFFLALLLTPACDRSQDDSTEKSADEQVETGTEDDSATEQKVDGYVLNAESGDNNYQVEGDVIGRNSAGEFGPECTGFIADDPSFTFQVTGEKPVDAVIALSDAGGIDATMVLDGPGGPYCNDDGAGNLLPRVRQRLSPGSYSVYVGAYQKNQGAHYQATISEARAAFSIAECDASRTIEVGSDFDEAQVSGTFEGNGRFCTDAVGIECDGQLPDAPGPCIEVSEPAVVRISVTDADFDTIMVLQAEEVSDRLYNDDGPRNTNSEIIAALKPGSYALHVGRYESNSSGNWSVTIEDMDLEVGSDGKLVPEYKEDCETLTSSEPLSLVSTSKPIIACSRLLGDDACPGYIQAAANHCVELEEGMSVNLTILEANFDTTLAIKGQSPSSEDILLYNDDASENLLSAISSPLPEGRYQIFVGSISPSEAGPYRLEVSAK